jgi:molybdopterin-guanine dinucleotide biosynthesis protein A
MKNRISAAILAGGPASRLNGVIKPKMEICGETIIARTVALLKVLFSEIIIVTNTPGEFTEYTDCIIIPDQFTGIGPLGGIHAALSASSSGAVFIFAGDMPLLSLSLIEKQLEFFETNSCEILVPKSGESIEPLHSIYRRTILNRLSAYLSDRTGNAVHEFFTVVDTGYMEMDENESVRNAFSNINLPSDIAAIEKIIRSQKP